MSALILGSLFAIACGNTSDVDDGAGDSGVGGDTASSGGTGGEAAAGGSSGGSSGSSGTAGAAGSGQDAGEDASAARPCSVVTLDLHASTQVYVTLADMQTHVDPPGEYSFVMQKMSPAPIVYLGPGVQAINLGPDPGFDNVHTAPESGYATDEPEPVIGRAYKSGGSGTTGFEMTGNVFVLLHPNGSYAKLAWTSAVAGVVTIHAHHSATTDLRCSW